MSFGEDGAKNSKTVYNNDRNGQVFKGIFRLAISSYCEMMPRFETTGLVV